MADRNFKLIKVDKAFDEMLERQNKKLASSSFNGKKPGMRLITKRLVTPDFEKILDAQLSKDIKKFIRI